MGTKKEKLIVIDTIVVKLLMNELAKKKKNANIIGCHISTKYSEECASNAKMHYACEYKANHRIFE